MIYNYKVSDMRTYRVKMRNSSISEIRASSYSIVQNDIIMLYQMINYNQYLVASIRDWEWISEKNTLS